MVSCQLHLGTSREVFVVSVYRDINIHHVANCDELNYIILLDFDPTKLYFDFSTVKARMNKDKI